MSPIRIQIETVSPQVVEELKKENEKLRNEIKRLQGQHNGLHETVYRFMEHFAEMKRSLKER